VATLQTYLNDRLGLRFRLLVERSSVVVIGPETRPNPPHDLPLRRGESTYIDRFPLSPSPPLSPIDAPLTVPRADDEQAGTSVTGGN